MTAPTPDSFDSHDGRTYSEPVSAVTPGQAGVPEMEQLVRAARKYDYANRVKGSNWGSVPEAQVARLLTGALAAIAARQPQDAPELAELKRRTASLYRLVDDILSHVEATSVRPSDAARVEAWRKRADDA